MEIGARRTEQKLSVSTRVIKAELLPAKSYYDFHVPLYENYLACGMIHHNTAKSMCAKALAKELEMPLLIMDYAAVKGSLVGESETRLKDTLAQVRAIKRSVLLIDS